jgi:DNA polymerase IIIc chi subunit
VQPSDWVSLAAVILAAIAVVATFITARQSVSAQERTTREAIRADRALAVEERLWQRQADSYVALLTWVEEAAVVEPRQPAEVRTIPESIVAELLAFGSVAVRTQAEMVRHVSSIHRADCIETQEWWNSAKWITAEIWYLQDVVRGELLGADVERPAAPPELRSGSVSAEDLLDAALSTELARRMPERPVPPRVPPTAEQP